jgi:hypothetical protein
MAAEQQVIDYGNTANDGTGDSLRDAFIKVDDNFSNIWAAGPVGSNVTIVNNTIGVTNTNGNLILSPNGVGFIQTNNTVVPRANNTYNLGSANLTYRSIYVGSGGATVAGNITVGAIFTDNYYYANGAPFSGGGNGNYSNANVAAYLPVYSGNILAGNIAVNNNITVGGNASTTGNVSANYFLGNGSQLTGINASTNKIFNGTSNVEIGSSAGNITASVNSVANVITIGQTQLTVNGVIATPRTLTANTVISENVSAMMISPLTIPNGLEITVPASSVFNIIP